MIMFFIHLARRQKSTTDKTGNLNYKVSPFRNQWFPGILLYLYNNIKLYTQFKAICQGGDNF
jgi:hypothetical protein